MQKNVKKETPLNKLFIKEEDVNQELLADTLFDFIRIQKKRNRPIFQNAYDKLKEEHKILAYLLFRLAISVLGGHPEKKGKAKPKKISEETGVKYNSVRGYLSQFNRKKIVAKEKGGTYYIPSYSLRKVAKKLNDSKDKITTKK